MEGERKVNLGPIDSAEQIAKCLNCRRAECTNCVYERKPYVLAQKKKKEQAKAARGKGGRAHA